MSSNEDILMQFTAQDDISSVAEEIEANVSNAFLSATSAVEELDMGLANLVSSADSVSSAFEEMESSIDSAEASADSFQTTLSNINSGNLSEVASSASDVGDALVDAEEQAESLAGTLLDLDGTTVDINIEASGISDDGWDADAELGGELTEQDTSALRASMYDDMVAFSGTLKDVGTQAVESASAAEQGWMRFGNAARNTGVDWTALQDQIKGSVRAYSDEMGRGIADTRTAMTTFMNMGMSLSETQETMKAVSNYAAQFGISQSEAAKSLQMAFMGAGRSVKKLGLDIKDFKDSAGNVDREKLLAAVMEKTSGAAERYANSYEARVQRMNNAINSLRTDFGREIINTIEPLIPIVQQAFQAFTSLPQPVKSTVLAFAGLAGGAAIVAGPLIKMRAYMNMAGLEMGTLTTGLKTLRVGFSTLAGGGGIRSAITAMKEFAAAQKAAKLASDAGGFTTGAGKGMSTVEKEAGKVIKSGSGIGGMSGAANTAGAEMQATSTGLRGIGQGAMTMLAPLLQIAIVVAVLIPVITALAAEALIFLKGLQLLIDALDFDKIDLTGAIEGIKQIGRALLEMGIAMAEMTFANVMTGLAVLTSGVTGLINPIQVAGALLINAAKELEVFNNVKIDPSIPENIKSISEALKLVSDAMTSLTNVVVNMAFGNLVTLGGLLGTVSSAITTAKNEITHAASEISSLKDLPDIDQGAVDKLEKVSSSLESVANAMEALRSLRDGQNWDNLFGEITNLFGGIDIQAALSSVREDIYKASAALSQFAGVSDIPDGVSSKLKKVADTLKSVSESVETLRKLRDDYNWDASWGNIFQGTDIPGAINSIKNDLFKVSASLRTLHDISEIPEGTGQKIQRVAWTTNNVITAVKSLKNLNGQIDGNVDLSNVVSSMAKANNVIRQVATRLNSLGNIAAIPEGLGGKINKITSATNSVKNSVSAMNSMPQVSESTTERVRQAVTTVRNVATQLSRLGNINVNEGIGASLKRISDAITQLRATLSKAGGGFRSSGMNIGRNISAGINAGMTNLPGVVTARVRAAGGAGASAAWTAGARMGSNGTRGFQSAFKLAQVVSSEMTYSVQAVQNGTGPFVQAVTDMANQAVQAAQNALDQESPGRIARMWGAEMGFSSDLVSSRGQGLINTMRDITNRVVGVGNANLNAVPAWNTFNLNPASLSALNTMNQSSDLGKKQRPVNIIVNEGAVQLDARNLTTEESRQIMVNAMEGMEDIEYVEVNPTL